MPLLASFIGGMTSALVGFFARFVSFNVALKLAAYTTWLSLFAAFAAAVLGCISSLFTMATSFYGQGAVNGNWVSFFFMGAGMFIPANAGAVMSCVGSVWIATSVWKIQKTGIENFSK